jgi:hypothetical protein
MVLKLMAISDLSAYQSAGAGLLLASEPFVFAIESLTPPRQGATEPARRSFEVIVSELSQLATDHARLCVRTKGTSVLIWWEAGADAVVLVPPQTRLTLDISDR